MTLSELHKKVEILGKAVTSADIPLKLSGQDCVIDLELDSDYENGKVWVNVNIYFARSFEEMLNKEQK